MKPYDAVLHEISSSAIVTVRFFITISLGELCGTVSESK